MPGAGGKGEKGAGSPSVARASGVHGYRTQASALRPPGVTPPQVKGSDRLGTAFFDLSGSLRCLLGYQERRLCEATSR